MTRRLVLVDTSALAEALREGGDVVVRERVRELLAATRNEREYQRLERELGSRHILAPPDHVWERAARLGYELRQQGRKAPLEACVTAVVAMHNNVKLLHRDRHFPVIATICDLDEEYVGPPEPEA